ncbi:MAG: Flp pilus assembly complex ATPase component TadA [Phycisphaerales bacterium]|nr:Flp pilus assembly complex ATPase component TadA [Phycisphaerales bacterium]
MPYLEVKTSSGKKRLKLGTSPISIGRQSDNTLVITDDRASRHHCVIEPWDDGFRIRDLGSRNGTKLNEERVKTESLDNGDVVRIGNIEIAFIDPEAATRVRPKSTPDYGMNDLAPLLEDPLHRQATLDIDLNTDLANVQTDYEKKLKAIIDAGIDKSFTDRDISLVDSRGVTIHQAEADGLDTGSDDDTGEGIRVFRLLLLACFRSRATDLHIEPRISDASIRLRVDGYMLSAVELSMALFKRILGVVKILCQIDTSQKSTVQDGHFSVSVKGRRVDYRVSLTPSMHGQKLVIRVLDSANAPSRLHELGLIPWMYEKLRTVATKDAGLLLACGPTGSGKTTTLYSCLREIDVELRNAITIEDPVEYYLEGCTQIPIDHKQGNSFGSILRSVLRQDPDVIFVGEIRDVETAKVAMQASMTGHLVYSTVHSKDSIGAIFRLLDLGVEPYLVATGLNLILAQRLVRVLCDTCKRPVVPTPAQTLRMGKSLEGVRQIYVPAGCKRCFGTGYIGRRALFELLEVNDSLRDIILREPTITKIREVLNQGLFTTLAEFGGQLVAQGVTATEEIERVAGSEG